MSETAKVDVLTIDGKKKGSVELPAELFDTQTNIPLIHQVVTAQLAAARQGTHATKTRGEVSGGGAKPWRQKGTGRARQGSRRAPQWTGGGVVHGPQPRSYAQKTPKRMIAAALAGVLSDRARGGLVFVLDGIVKGDTPSTKQAQQALSHVGMYPNYLVVLDRDDYAGWLSVRNLPEVHVVAVDQLNAYDVVTSEAIVFTKTALEIFIAGPTSGKGVTVVVSESELDELVAELTETEEAPAEAAETPAEEAAPVAKTKKSTAKKPTEPEVVESEREAPQKPAAKKAATKKDETEEEAK
jgi:large subunit ribosomal protein L4